ncbi:hypothetical protein DCCM_4482 [Desulfocucumis palustris]|uniref:Uncharacterized protein n=1 Tax=Desulfocucumis palustris TaxID=1898651 RepID=A0A2L2XG78_9FIRM|nr:hypothetical protein DCCM_4482 [Desulfocucumis palustris]
MAPWKINQPINDGKLEHISTNNSIMFDFYCHVIFYIACKKSSY